VTIPRRPFRLNVGFLIKQPVGYSHEFPFDFEEIQIDGDLDLRHFNGVATFGRTPQGLILQGEFSADIGMQCVRCLTDFYGNIHWTMTELFAFTRRNVAESGLLLPEDAQVDLAPLIREYALLEIPINPICKQDCKGLCLVCGENLNQRDCGHQPEMDESPFSVLKDLLDK